MRPFVAVSFICFALAGFRCSSERGGPARPAPAAGVVAPATPLGFRVLQAYPHDREAFTQGLVYHDGFLYESTGLYGPSSLRKVEIATGKVLKRTPVDARFFAEGLALLDGVWYQLTWQNGQAFAYTETPEGFQATDKAFPYQGEGWGLTTDGKSLILSDGSDRLRFLDPKTKAVVREVAVRDGGAPVFQINELEYARGRIFANVWQTSRIVVINPDDGRVEHYLDVDANVIMPDEAARSLEKNEDVLNGIAYRPDTDRFYLTGKKWPLLFEVDIDK